MASTITVSSIVKSARAYPEFIPLLDAAGWEGEPALTIANDVMQKFMSEPLNWKFNRAYVAPFLSVVLQQDYVTNYTDVGWLEQGWRIDINNTLAGSSTGAPKPVYALETVRDLAMTAYQSNPFNVSYIPNSLAFLGQWSANTNFLTGYMTAMAPTSPIQQFKDVNGNILFLSSAALGLNIQSPGYPSGTAGDFIPQPGFGMSGTVQPAAPPNAIPGTTVPDGDLVWTVANPNGFAMRVAPLPAVSGLTWLLWVVYQKKAPKLTTLSQTIDPIPDEYAFMFRDGFFAKLRIHAQPGSRAALEAYQMWEESLYTTLKASDREREDMLFYPSTGITGDGPWSYSLPVGPSWPYGGIGF